ncbi:glycosyltransferase involved in cell wall biosynthesis [Pontibacter aydingkolensis]|uniref:Glycosyltransferase n=1 Tax=Pontibacter aydingkolensis TaxID=1911536 RepID=A0ABS7CUG2_9BACT|nr:glycosyltransferase [Pontibacter aydingkolensis]MBW7467483.1 glycosyltransferase [Pontibacter aydingkolensis]
MKRLLFAVTTDLNHDQRMQRICGSLAKQGYEVELIGRQKPDSKPLLQQPYTQHRIRCKYNEGKLFYLEYMLRLYFYLGTRRYDALCAIDLDTALPVYFQAKKKQVPFIYDAHEYFPEVIEVTDRKLVKAAWTAIEKFIVTRTKYAYTVTQSIADIFYRKYNTRFEVIRNMPVLQPSAPVSKEPRTILYQGAVNTGRGLEPLLEAMVGLDAKLIICGIGDEFDNLKILAKDLKIEDRVEFKGQVLPGDLLQITRTCRVGMMLLENKGLSYYYSLANKFFDYVHAGVPQLVIDFPEYRQLNEKYKVGLLTSLDVKELRGKLALLLTDEQLYQTLTANCLEAKQELNWQHEEQKLLRFYEELWQVKKNRNTW